MVHHQHHRHHPLYAAGLTARLGFVGQHTTIPPMRGRHRQRQRQQQQPCRYCLSHTAMLRVLWALCCPGESQSQAPLPSTLSPHSLVYAVKGSDSTSTQHTPNNMAHLPGSNPHTQQQQGAWKSSQGDARSDMSNPLGQNIISHKAVLHCGCRNCVLSCFL